MARRAIAIDAAADHVSTGRFRGLPKILVHPLHDSGFGRSYIVVIEESDPDPWATVLFVGADGVSWSELNKIASQLRL